MEKEKVDSLKGEGSSCSGYTHVWKTIWSLHVRNAVKVFLWRACANILPTKDNLLRRGVVKEAQCIFRHKDIESVLHILWECPSADAWSVCDIRIQKSQVHYLSFLDVLDNLITQCSKGKLNMFALISKKPWARRNAVVHGGDFSHPTRIVQEAGETMKQLMKVLEGEVTTERAVHLGIVAIKKWKNPPFGRYKVNWDVAVDAHRKCLGCGTIVRDHMGLVIAA